MSRRYDTDPDSGWEIESSRELLILSQRIFENDEGQKMLLKVSGPEQQVEDYLAELSLGFRARQVDSSDEALEQLRRDYEEEWETVAWPMSDPTAVNVQFQFLELEPPYVWDVLFDPKFDVRIAGSAAPHNHQTTKATKINATITADFGELEMTVGNRKVKVHTGNPTRSLPGEAGAAVSFSIQVNGLKPANQYDLRVSGATLL